MVIDGEQVINIDIFSEDTVSTADRDDDKVFLWSVGDDLLGGSEGPWTTGMSVSLSSPKLVMNSTTPGAEALGDLDLERDDDILQHVPVATDLEAFADATIILTFLLIK